VIKTMFGRMYPEQSGAIGDAKGPSSGLPSRLRVAVWRCSLQQLRHRYVEGARKTLENVEGGIRAMTGLEKGQVTAGDPGPLGQLLLSEIGILAELSNHRG
jgi:hypothetical protein